jgi:hypothetical protein
MTDPLCELMAGIAKSAENGQPGNPLEVAQQTIGTELGATVAIGYRRNDHHLGCTVTFTAFALTTD